MSVRTTFAPSAHTVPFAFRAWERRYGVVAPRRDARGRMYSDDDVAKLRLLRVLVGRGHAIGRLAGLSAAEMETLAAGPAPAGGADQPARLADGSEIDLEPMVAALERYDGQDVDRQLGRMAAVLRPRELVVRVVLPLLRRVGEAWQAGSLTVAQEHLATASLRSLLGALVRLHVAPRPAATVLFATPPGERHELGLLAAAMLAAGAGLGVLYLGPDVPADDIVQAARRCGAEAVVVGVTGAGGEAPALQAVRDLAARLPRGVKLLAGGARTEPLGARLQEAGAAFLADFDALEATLSRLGARF